LQSAIAAGEAQFVADVEALHGLRTQVIAADEAVGALRIRTDAQDALIKEARALLDSIRAEVSERDLARAAAEAELSHLAYTCEDAVHASIQDVVAEMEQLERDGRATPDASAIGAEESEDDSDDAASVR